MSKDTTDVPNHFFEKDTGKETHAVIQKYSQMTEEEKKLWAIQKLRKKAEEVGHMPTKADFEPPEKIRIKAVFGPWPRALEAAGLKTPKEQKKSNRR